MKTVLFAGGYTEPILQGTGEIVEGRCKGIVTYLFDTDTGHLEPFGTPYPTPNPSYILISSDNRSLYCVNELKNYHDVDGSTITAFAIEPETGSLRQLNLQASCGEDACHLAFSADERFLMTANYSGGSFCMFPIRKDRSLAPAACVIAHIGSGAHPLRQASAHPHQILIAPDRKHIYVSDLGLDCLKCYRADWTKQILIPEEQRDIAGLPGQGMRHGVFSKDGRFLYVMTELSCELNVFAFDDFALTPTLVQRCSCLPEGRETGAALGSGVRIHSNGQWLYCAVRGIDQILAFEIGKTGMLQPLQSISCGGSGPREFVLSPDGKFLLAGNQNTDNISVFEIDAYTGKLRPTGQNVECPCVTVLAFAQL